MPCYDPHPYDKERLNNVTRMLCAVMRAVESNADVDTESDIPKEIWDWYEEHKKFDGSGAQ